MASAATSGAIIRSLRPERTRLSSSSCRIVRLLEQVPLLMWFEQAKRLAPHRVPAPRQAGHQLDRVQRGLDPDDWKPMKTVGSGAREIRIRDADGAFRVIYVTKFADAIHVPHCFQKKTEKAARVDVELAARGYRELARELEKSHE